MAGNDSNTVSLLHFDGANGGTTFTDVNAGGSAKTWSVGGGSPVTSTTSPQLGSASLSLPGSAWINTPDTADFHFGTGDFTFDYWVKRGGTGATRCWGYADSGLAAYQHCEFTASNQVQFAMNNDLYIAYGGATITDTTTWHHVAITRFGNNIQVAVDGVFGTSVSVTGITWTNSAGNMVIGRLGDYTAGTTFTGNIDEFRISKGIARWTANFTPPTAPYGVDYTSAITESGTATEAESAIASFVSSLTEAATAIETENAGSLFIAAITEAATATESEDRAFTTPASIVEAASASEAETVAAAFVSAVTEFGAATESTSALAAFLSAITEAATAADIPSGYSVFFSGVIESASASEIETATAAFVSTIAEAAVATNTQSVLASFVASITEAGIASDRAFAVLKSIVQKIRKSPFVLQKLRKTAPTLSD